MPDKENMATPIVITIGSILLIATSSISMDLYNKSPESIKIRFNANWYFTLVMIIFSCIMLVFGIGLIFKD